MKALNKYIDHTLLKPEATEADIRKLCREAKEYGFYSVCVNGCYVKPAAEELAGTDVKVAAVIGFPLGAMSTECKAAEAALAVHDGADEIDMVMQIGAMKEGRYDAVQNDIRAVKEVMNVQGEREGRSTKLKVILETCLLTRDEIVKACELAEAGGADFVKTSTGFSKGGATAEDVALMKQTVGDRLEVKASGGIRDRETALRMIEAGADRIGASAGIAIVSEPAK